MQAVQDALQLKTDAARAVDAAGGQRAAGKDCAGVTACLVATGSSCCQAASCWAAFALPSITQHRSGCQMLAKAGLPACL